MTQSEYDNLLDHEYDGIREYDNPTPGWWHALFLASVLFSVGYLFFFHVSVYSWTPSDEWEQARAAEFRRIFGAIGELEPDEPTILRMMQDDTMLSVAEGLFVANCAACHGRTGSGISGVNLTDDYWNNVKNLEDIYTIISQGAAVGAMPGWDPRLSRNERVILTAYVANLRSDTPAAGRGPEGEPIPAWPSPGASD